MRYLFMMMGLTCLWFSSFSQDATVKQLKESTEQKIVKDAADTIPAKWKKGGLFTFN